MCDEKDNIIQFPDRMKQVKEAVFACGTCGCQEFYILRTAFECCECGMQVEITITDEDEEDGSENH